MSYLSLLPAYLSWHYSEAYREIIRVWTNFVWFSYNFFSLPLMLKGFFAPWQRITEKRTKPGFHPEDIAEAVVTTTIMRLVGMLFRSVVIIVGTALTLLVFWGGLVFFIAWTFLPILAVGSVVYGVTIFV